MVRSTLAVAAALAVAVPIPLAGQQMPLQSQAERLLAGASGTWGVMAWAIDSDRPLFAINANEPLIPASNNKVFTAVWALDMFGAGHRFPTDLLVTGDITGGVLQGDVVLRGSGDPAFGYPQYERDPMDPLRRMAERLRQMGVTRISGGVVGDPTVFDSVTLGPEWPRDTGGGSAYYAPRVSGLAFQRNVVYVRPQAAGGQIGVQLEPAVSVVPVSTAGARAGNGRGWAVRHPDSAEIQLRGAVSPRGNQRYPVGVRDPALFAADALRVALEQAGIQVSQPTRLGATPESAELVHRHLSIPVGAMIPQLNRDSDNFFAEQLWKASAAKAAGQGSYRTGGPVSALHFIRRAGVPAGQIYQFDGSGLSSYNRASANSLVRTLAYAHRRPYSELLHNSMAVAGGRDGTLRRLFRGTPAEGNLHAKTGYINHVRTLSGYVRAANGEIIAFAFLYNGRNTFGARDVQTELGTLLANYGGAAPALADTATADAR